MRNAQLPLDAKVKRADQESDEIEEALGQLLASQPPTVHLQAHDAFLEGKERNAPSLVSARHPRASSTHPYGRSPRNSPLITNHQPPAWPAPNFPATPT